MSLSVPVERYGMNTLKQTPTRALRSLINRLSQQCRHSAALVRTFNLVQLKSCLRITKRPIICGQLCDGICIPSIEARSR